jgi:hypothetical protein
MTTFVDTNNPTPFGIYDNDADFPTKADEMVTFVKRKLGDDVLSVELTKKQIWANFEEAVLEYSSILNKYQAKSQLVSFLGYATGSLEGSEEKYIRENLEFLARSAEPYAMEAGIGGSYGTLSGSIQLEASRQDYNIYTELSGADGGLFDSTKGKIRVDEIFHYNPQAAYRFFDTTSAINYLNNEFSFESFTPETIFYVLPVYEDILRAGQLDLSNRVRKSNYSFRLSGENLRIYPSPTSNTKLFLRIRQAPDPLSPVYHDATVHGVSNLGNIPFGNIKYERVNSIGRQWIRNYTLASSKEMLGYIRGKFGSIPVPNETITLNSSDLLTHGREEKKDLVTQLTELLDSMTYDKLIEVQAGRAENINKQLKFSPIPNGKAIFMG